MDELKACPFTRKEKLAVSTLKIDNGDGAYILKRDADVILCYIKFLQLEVERLSAQPENKPLTLEQLKGMDGNPVWAIWQKSAIVGYSIVNAEKQVVTDKNGWFLDFADYGKGWLAYARKLEQEEK